MSTMTQELQDAYNEWLLMYGFRVVPRDEIHAAGTLLESKHTSYKDWTRCLHFYYSINSYQLRTLEDIEIYDKQQNNS